MSISRSIVQAVRSLDPPGRFLDKDTVTGLWHDIGHKKAVEKTSQALRDGAAILRKQLSADLGDPNFLNAVFNEDGNKTNVGDKDEREGRKISIKTNGKENAIKDSKGNSTEKIKVVKVCFFAHLDHIVRNSFRLSIFSWKIINSLSLECLTC